MKVISFDIGLRNLAYCVLEGTSRTDVTIVDWNIIDVLGEQAGVGAPRCHKCNSSARYEHASKGLFSCAKHTPKKKAKVTKAEINNSTKNSPRKD